MKKKQQTSDLPSWFTGELIAAAKIEDHDKDSYLFHVGEPVTGIYYILSGEVKACRPMHDEREAVMMRARAGEFFAESAIAAPTYSCDGLAVVASCTAFLPTLTITTALNEPTFAKAFFLANAANGRRQCSRYERLRLRSARDRILHLLTCEAGPDGVFFWQPPLVELAAELALEPETLYRVLSELERDGLIIRSKGRLKITFET